MRDLGNDNKQDVQKSESEGEEDKDGWVELEERNNASHFCYELEYVMEGKVDEQHNREDNRGNQNNDSEFD